MVAVYEPALATTFQETARRMRTAVTATTHTMINSTGTDTTYRYIIHTIHDLNQTYITYSTMYHSPSCAF
jgi:hypothetical protein